MMKKIIIFGLIITLFSSCIVLEHEVTMRNFNYLKNLDNHLLTDTVSVDFVYKPLIEAVIIKNPRYLESIDSSYINQMKDVFIRKFKQVKINSKENSKNNYTIFVNQITFNEEKFNSTYQSNGTSQSSTENRFDIMIAGKIVNNLNQQEKKIVAFETHQTSTRDGFLIPCFTVKDGATLKKGVLEENKINDFVIQCVKFINQKNEK